MPPITETFLRRTWMLIRQKDVHYKSAAISFHLFLCAIPFALILFSVLGYILSTEAAYDELLRYARELLPSFRGEEAPVQSLLDPLIGSRGALGVTGLLTMAFFSLSLVQVVKHTLLMVLDVTEKRHPLLAALHNVLVFSVFGSLFLFFSLLLTVLPLLDLSEWPIPLSRVVVAVGTFVDQHSEWAAVVIPFLFTFIMLLLTFRTVSERRISWRSSAFGALVFTGLYETVRLIASWYLDYSLGTYRFYYQGYTLIVLLAFWGYYSALIFVISSITTRVFMERRGEWITDHGAA
jgi:YihY family inner membrane protein